MLLCQQLQFFCVMSLMFFVFVNVLLLLAITCLMSGMHAAIAEFYCVSVKESV